MKKKASIHIGEFYVSEEPAIIYTLLGSCVAVCIHNPIQQTGGMNHILLPGKAVSGSNQDPLRYARNAIELLISSVSGLGGLRRQLIAKVFGGSHLLSSMSGDRSVGRILSEFVLDFLHQEKVNIAGYDLGGTDVRKIFFHTDTGDVFLKRSTMREKTVIIEKEREGIRMIQNRIENDRDWYPRLPEK